MKKEFAFAAVLSLAFAGACAMGPFEGPEEDVGAGAGVPGGAPEFSVLDEDNNGVLNRSEAMDAAILSGNFDEADLDNDSRITVSEYQSFVGTAMGAPARGGRVDDAEIAPTAPPESRGRDITPNTPSVGPSGELYEGQATFPETD